MQVASKVTCMCFNERPFGHESYRYNALKSLDNQAVLELLVTRRGLINGIPEPKMMDFFPL